MAREVTRTDGAQTRERLLRAGEQLFAARGLEVPLAEVQRRAGLRNNAAVHYYFGSRDDLVTAILTRHQREIERDRAALLDAIEADAGDAGDLAAYVRALAVPLANRLRTPEGRDYLLILPQVLHRMEASRTGGTMPDALRRTLEGIEAAMHTTPTEARARSATLSAMQAGVLADRARQLGDGRRPMAHDRFVAMLVEMLIGAARAGSGHDA